MAKTTTVEKSFNPTDRQLQLAYGVLARAGLVRKARAELVDVEERLMQAKYEYKKLVSSLAGVPLSELKFSNDRCLNEVASFHVYRLDDDAHPCVFCSTFEPDEDNP